MGMRKEIGIFGNDYPTPDGTGVRDYVHVTDLADAHVKAAEYLLDQHSSLVVNLGSEEGISVREIVEEAKKVTNKEITEKIVGRRAGDPAKLVASSTKAKEILGWSAKHSSVQELIESTWKAYLKSKDN
jgi:UDP-glucose 4-epimerase